MHTNTRSPTNGARPRALLQQQGKEANSERLTHMTSQQPQQQHVEVDWGELDDTSKAEVKVPVSLFALCKTVVEDDQGALYLNATLVQRILVENIPPATSTTTAPASSTSQEDSISTDDEKKLKALLFPISIKGPIPGDPAKSRRVDVVDVLRCGGARTSISKLCSETLDLVHAPLDVHQHWYRFPFRILKATVDLELQAKYRPSEFGGGKVLFCPDLLSPKITGDAKDDIQAENLARIIKVKLPGRLSRLRRLAFIRELPVVQILPDIRLKKGKTQRKSDDDMFIRHPQLRLTFWLHEPTSKAIFKIVGPLVLVVSLMLMNFQEFFGFSAILNEFESASGSETYQDYLANGIGIALAAFFVIPSIRAETTKSPGVSFTWDDCIAVIFLVGLALSNAPQCHVAFAGCVLCVLVVLVALFSLALHENEVKAIRKKADAEPLIVLPPDDDGNKNKSRAIEFDETQWKRI